MARGADYTGMPVVALRLGLALNSVLVAGCASSSLDPPIAQVASVAGHGHPSRPARTIASGAPVVLAGAAPTPAP